MNSLADRTVKRVHDALEFIQDNERFSFSNGSFTYTLEKREGKIYISVNYSDYFVRKVFTELEYNKMNFSPDDFLYMVLLEATESLKMEIHK